MGSPLPQKTRSAATNETATTRGGVREGDPVANRKNSKRCVRHRSQKQYHTEVASSPEGKRKRDGLGFFVEGLSTAK
jgi:hypothetical protein